MAAQHHGTMVFFASDRGQLGSAQAGPYAASKGGVIALVKSLALALGEVGVTVNAVNPGPTDTPMLTDEVRRQRMAADPLGKLSRPEEIGQIVLFLCGPAHGFMTGQVVTTRMR
jgi:NAD(P)-dependent dehydrogenase (short-subunit alcohol dehydrogenase family)